jgi:hypothetical protein
LRHGCRCPSPARTSSNNLSRPCRRSIGLKMGGSRYSWYCTNKRWYCTNLFVTGIFTKTLREECSGGVRRRAWVRFGLRQPVKKTTSTCDNLVWLTCTRRVHPASRRSQVLYRVCAPGNRHGAPVPWSRDRRKGPTVAFSLKISNFCTLVQRISTIVLICGTKFVPVTLVYHGYRYRAPISVIVNYLNDTTVGQCVCVSLFYVIDTGSIGSRAQPGG